MRDEREKRIDNFLLAKIAMSLAHGEGNSKVNRSTHNNYNLIFCNKNVSYEIHGTWFLLDITVSQKYRKTIVRLECRDWCFLYCIFLFKEKEICKNPQRRKKCPKIPFCIFQSYQTEVNQIIPN